MLTVVPTPIGNLGDITLRALTALREAEVIACEDTRRTRALLSAHEIPAPRLVVCDERRESGVAEELAALAASGTRVALVSDAGTPALADPGREVVRTALAAGAPLTVLPGASAVTTALVASGLAAEGFAFWGWVPRRGAERARWLERAASAPLPVVAFESPKRLLATLAAAPAGASVAVCRELSKLHEEVVRGAPHEVAAAFSGREVRGEVVLVFAAGQAAGAGAERDEAAHEAVRALASEGLGARRAAEIVSRLTGVSRRELYDAAASSRRQLPHT